MVSAQRGAVVSRQPADPTVSWLQVRPDSGCPLGLGNLNGYCNRACRCAACCEAHTAQHYDYMQRHPEQREKSRQLSQLRWHAGRAGRL